MKGRAELLRMMQRLRNVANGQLPVLLAQSMQKETAQNFREEGYGNDGSLQKWAPRRFETSLKYKKLQYSGAMRKSLKVNIRRMGNRQASIIYGSNDPVFRVHQMGGPTMPNGSHGGDMGFRKPPKSSKPVKIGGARVKARPMIGFGSRSRKWFTGVIRREIDRVIHL